MGEVAAVGLHTLRAQHLGRYLLVGIPHNWPARQWPSPLGWGERVGICKGKRRRSQLSTIKCLQLSTESLCVCVHRNEGREEVAFCERKN